MSALTSLALSTENEFSSLPCNEALSSMLSVASIQAPNTPESESRAGMDIIAVLDRSGSMSGAKMKMLQRTVGLMIDNLGAKDRICLVAYDDVVETPLDLTYMTPEGKQKAHAAAKTVDARGTTNLSGGLLQGCAMVNSRVEKNEVCSILLLTDGLANRGITDPKQLVEAVQTQVKQFQNPVSIYTFGFGSDHNESLLSDLATTANGTYYFMHSVESIPEAFGDCIGGLMSVTAQNISLTITAAPGVTINKIPSQYSTTTVVEGQEYRVAVGDIFSEERKDILVDLQVPTADCPVEEGSPLLSLRLEYFNLLCASQQEFCETVVLLPRTEPGSERGSASLSVDAQRNRIETAKAMEEAQQLADSGALEQARMMLQRTALNIQGSASAGGAVSSALAQDLHQLETCQMQSESVYQAKGKKKLAAKSKKHWRQREAEVDEDEVCMYMNQAKAMTRAGFR